MNEKENKDKKDDEKTTYDEEDIFTNAERGGKLFLLLEILAQCSSIGDKMYV